MKRYSLDSAGTRNIRLFTSVSSIWAVVSGFIGPFYVLKVSKLSGDMEKLGLAFSIMVLFNSLSTYSTGVYSDKLGRKPFLFVVAYVEAIIIFSYTVINQTYQLYILQALIGLNDGISATIRTSLLGDLTNREERGRSVGKFNAFVKLSSASGLAVGGYIAKSYGLEFIFYIASIVVASSTFLLFFINEA